jgi:LacI family transcriptional regulator
VATVNSDIDSKRLCCTGCDYFKSGRTAGQLLGMVSRPDTNVAIITGSFSMKGHNQRIEGFRQAMAEYGKLTVEDVVACEDDDEVAYAQTKDILQSSPINALYAAAGGVGGILRAVSESGSRIIVITNDLTPVVRQYIETDWILASICQEPFQQGYQSVKRMYGILADKKLPEAEFYYTETTICIKSNL